MARAPTRSLLLVFLVLAASGCAAQPLETSPTASSSDGRIQPTRSSGASGVTDPDAPRPPPDYANISAYWENRTRLTVIDRGFEWHQQGSPPLLYYTLATQAIANPCVSSYNGRYVYFNNRQVSFDKGSQTVWPGTGKLEVTLTWTMEDSLVENLAMGYRAQGDHAFNQTGYMEKGKTYSHEVKPEYWDLTGAPRSTWEFWVCVSQRTSEYGRLFYGSFHLKMDLVRGTYPDP